MTVWWAFWLGMSLGSIVMTIAALTIAKRTLRAIEVQHSDGGDDA